MATILITGAGRGLGLELARQYREDGWRVIGTLREELDVSNMDQVKELSSKLKGLPIDVLFCNAGISGKRGMALGSFDYDEWEKVLRVNLLGAAAVIEALIQNVAASERKTVATLPYSTSKAALNLLAKGLAANLAPRGIIVVALSPGWVKTDMGGESAPLTPQASVRGLRNVISRLRREDSGKFFSYEGVIIPW
jgi:NAD(P)-dependent dehydrogenase (short-subunit alcohol dehydrogenase family)